MSTVKSPSPMDLTRARILAAWPIFGGEDPVTPPPVTPPPPPPPPPPPAPEITATALESLAKDPAKLASLLGQVGTLTQQNQQLSHQLQAAQAAAATGNDTTTKATKKLTDDLQVEKDKNAKTVEAFQATLLRNALAGAAEWHDIDDALSGIDPELVTFNIDLDKKVFAVEGVDKAAEDLLKRKPHFAKPKVEGTPTTPPVAGVPPVRQAPPSSGNPPAATSARDAALLTQRAGLISKYPVVAHGNFG